MINTLALINGARVIPEGWVCVRAQRFTPSGQPLLFSKQLQTDYWYHLTEIRCRWTREAGRPASIEIFNDLGMRAYQQGNLGQNAIDLRTLTTPGEIQAAGTQYQLRPAVKLSMWFMPGTYLTMKISALTGGTLDLSAHGRYYLKPEDGVI